MLKRYCTTPCTFYGYESNYKFCKACDGSDKKLLEDWMSREKEKRLYIQRMNEVNSLIENDPITKKVIDDVSKMVTNPLPVRIDTDWEFKPVKKMNQEQLNIYKQMLNNVYGARANAKYVSHKDRNDYVDAIAYCQNDIDMTNRLHKKLSEMEENDMNHTAYAKGNDIFRGYLAIEKVHFSGPVTAVIWNDHTKTVVRCQDGEDFDPEKGLAMAIAKKMFGNKGSYFDVFKEWIPEEEVKVERVDVNAIAESFERAGAIASKSLNKVFSGTCETCKYKDVLGYKWPCVKCNHGSKWKVKGE